jgi:hypothetical protein
MGADKISFKGGGGESQTFFLQTYVSRLRVVSRIAL